MERIVMTLRVRSVVISGMIAIAVMRELVGRVCALVGILGGGRAVGYVGRRMGGFSSCGLFFCHLCC